ncbi:MAG: ATP-binding protein, partial [Firmicutes bacterium]|nr:ATP-binding protein [Bacillota bacterium]
FSQVLSERDVTKSLAVQQFIHGADPEGNLPHRYPTYSGQDVIGVFAGVPEFPWGIVVEEPVTMALGPVGAMAGRIGFTALVIMSLVAGLSIYFAGRVTKPIEVLEEGARRVGNGELGHVIQVASPDEIGRLVAEFNRMTSRLRAQSENLRREKERLDLVVSGIGAGLALIGGNGETLWVNRTLAEWLPDGYSPLGKPCYEVLGRTDCTSAATCVHHRDCATGDAPSGHAGLPGEFVRTDRSTGRERVLRHRSFALEGGPGEPRFLEVVEDITQQKAMEAMVVQTDKLAALGQLAAGVAHEINNPLASVAAYAEDLMDRLREEGPQALTTGGAAMEYLSTIRQQVERCKGITFNLLKFARQGTPEERQGPEMVPVNETLKDTVALAGHRIRRQGVAVRWRLSDGLPPARAERARLQQVFLNLLTNALDAMEPRGGTLTLEVVRQADTAHVRITDTGRGIPPEDRPRVFEPFFTTKPPGKGTGLGLSICYGIVSEWGGHIQLESEPGRGTTVEVSLPAFNIESEAATVAAGTAFQPAPPATRRDSE